MKTLVVYYSRTGNTKKMGELIAKELHADIDEIIDHTDRSGIKGWIMGGRDAVKKSLTEITVTKDPADYDLVIIGTPVWAGPATPAFRTYIAQYKNKIKKVALFITSHVDGPKKAVDLLENVLDKKCLASVGWTNAELNKGQIEPKLSDFVKMLS